MDSVVVVALISHLSATPPWIFVMAVHQSSVPVLQMPLLAPLSAPLPHPSPPRWQALVMVMDRRPFVELPDIIAQLGDPRIRIWAEKVGRAARGRGVGSWQVCGGLKVTPGSLPCCSDNVYMLAVRSILVSRPPCFLPCALIRSWSDATPSRPQSFLHLASLGLQVGEQYGAKMPDGSWSPKYHDDLYLFTDQAIQGESRGGHGGNVMGSRQAGDHRESCW